MHAQPTSSLRVNGSFYLLFAMCAFLMFPLHEFAHYITYHLFGIDVHMTLNTASPKDQSLRKPIAELAGPLLNILVATGAAAAYRFLHRSRYFWAALALSSALMRLVVYVLVVVAALVTGSGLSLGNDEPIAAHLWGLPSLTFVGMFAIPFLIITWSVVGTFKASRVVKALHVAGLSLTMLGVGLLVGNVLDPRLFPNR
jgi:hypothetical protein